MSKLVKRLSVATLAMLIISSSLVGCGKTDAKSNVSAKATATAQTKPTLKVLNIWMKDDYNTYPVAKVAEEKTGYHVQYEALPQDKPEDKLNLLISSGEAYDLITIGGGASNKALYSDYARRGALMDLSSLMDKYGSNVKSSISNASFDSIKVDGKVYAIPTRTIEYAGTSLMVRQDWLEKLNMKAPTTIDEFVSMLKAFKEKDPGGNGADKNIPFTITGVGAGCQNLVGAFGMANQWNDVGGKLTPRAMDPAFKDYLTFMTGLYKDGLLDKEFVTNKDEIANEKFTSGRAGVIQTGWFGVSTLTDALKKNKPDAKISYLPTLKGKDGKSGLSVVTGLDRISFIPKTAKSPEDTMKWINAKLDKDTFKLLAIGEEGKHYTVKDGAYTPILPAFTDDRGQANNYLTGIDEKLYPTYWQARIKKDMRIFDAYDYINNKMSADTKKPDVLGMSPYLKEFSKSNQQLNTMTDDYMVKVIAGGESISNLDTFIQKYKTSGGDTSFNEVNDWYKTYKK